jgi:glycosyltransferase involved in cell wall biosynthesis
VNNVSTDHTHAVVAEFHTHPIRIIDFANHGVIAAARNRALHEASAPYVAFLDSDDWWYPRKLERCVERLDQGADLVCHAEEWRAQDSSRTMRYGPQARMVYREMLLGGNCLSTSAIVGRTSVFQQVGGFAERADFITAEDYDLWLRLSQRGTRIELIDDVLGVFRIHAASASSAISRNRDAEMAVVKSHLETSEFAASTVRQRLGLSHYSAARSFTKAHDFRNAWREFVTALRHDPLFARSYAGLALLLAARLRNLRQPERQ